MISEFKLAKQGNSRLKCQFTFLSFAIETFKNAKVQ